MSDYLSKVTEEHRVSSEVEAAALIEEAKRDSRFTLLKSSTEYKTVKAKGEIIDEFWKTTLVKVFNDLKEPTCHVDITYTVDNGFFPDPISVEDEE